MSSADAPRGLDHPLSRRRLLRSAGLIVGAAGLSQLLQACAPAGPATPAPQQPAQPAPASQLPAAPAVAPAAPPTSAPATAVPLPTYVPFAGPPADLAATPAGVDPGFLTFPRNLVKSVPETPGRGGDVSVFTVTFGGPPPPLDVNAAWRAVNAATGVNLKPNIVAFADYSAKFNTLISGADLADIMYVGDFLALPKLPDFLKAACADLTPHLSGDAIKDYPNLANIPAYAWPRAVYANAIYGIPVPYTGRFSFAQFLHGERLDEIGVTNPTSADDYLRVMKQLTRPGQGWGLGMVGANQSIYQAFLWMFGAPNNWRRDAAGTLTKDIETDEFRAAIGYARTLFEAGVVNPDSPTTTVPQAKDALASGKIAALTDGWGAYQTYWRQFGSADPNARLRVLVPPANGGGKGAYFFNVGSFGRLVLKKASDDRVKELLRVLNYLAAPFGTQEHLLNNYGVEGEDFTFNSDGVPTLTDKGSSETRVVERAFWTYLGTNPPALFNPAGWVKQIHADEEALVPIGVADPVAGVYSPAFGQKGAVLNQQIVDKASDIIYGRAQVSDLDQLVKDWRSGGGDQIRAEYEQLLR